MLLFVLHFGQALEEPGEAMLVNVAARSVALLGQPSGETPQSVNKHGDNS